MKLRLSLISVLALVLSAVVALGTPAVAGAANSKKVPVHGTTAKGAPVVGTFNIKHFKRVNKVVRAVGTYTGTVRGKHVTSSAWAPVKSINGTAIAKKTDDAGAADGQAASCSILDLTLGPLHLNLLGLVVDLNQVHLQITGEQGPGNLLGNLLCSVAGLLDGTPTAGLLQQITKLLNQILGQL